MASYSGPAEANPAANAALGSVGAAATSGWRARALEWLEDAYTRPGTKPFATLLDVTVMAVLISLLTMVLESIPDLSEHFHTLFFYIELVVVIFFLMDYVANIILRDDRLGYVFGPWGIIDLLAILPFFISVTNLTDLRAGWTIRALRAVRVARVLKLARLASTAEESTEGTQASPWRDFQFALVAACSVMVLAQVLLNWNSDQVFWLGFAIVASVNMAIHRWCVRHERFALSALMVFAALLVGVGAAMQADSAGMTGQAGSIAMVTVAFTTVTAIIIEGPAGAL